MRTVLQIFNSTLVHIETFIFTSGALAKTENMSDVKIIVVNAKLYSVELNGRILWLLEISLYTTKFYSCTKKQLEHQKIELLMINIKYQNDCYNYVYN